MPSSQGKIWYINNETNKIYRLDNYGYTMDTNEKYILLKDIENGSRWVMPQSDLYKERLINGRPVKLWEEMPDGWHPVGEEKRYPGYTNDPRKDVLTSAHTTNERLIGYRTTSINDFNTRRSSFKR